MKEISNKCLASSKKLFGKHELLTQCRRVSLKEFPKDFNESQQTGTREDNSSIRISQTIIYKLQRFTSYESTISLQPNDKHYMSTYFTRQILPSVRSAKCFRTRNSLVIIFLICLTALSTSKVLNANQYDAAGSEAARGTPLPDNEAPTRDNFVAYAQADEAVNESAPGSSAAAGSTAATCFGGLQTFEKISMSSFENPAGLSSSQGSGDGVGNSADGSNGFGSGILVQQDDQALTSECINLCRSQSNCLSFVIDYNKFECKSYAITQQELQQEFASKFQRASSSSSAGNSSQATSDSTISSDGYQQQSSSINGIMQQLLPSASSNYFEKICLASVSNRNQFGDTCGQGRLWTIERVVDSYLDGFVEKEVANVNEKDECSKLCILESQFVCRSADYDERSRVCRLSKEDRRTQPQAMRHAPNSQRQYLENQCASPGPSSCVYEQRKNVGIISMDALKFAQTAQDCQMKCNQETTFNCRSFSFHQQRCFLSGDDSSSLNSNLIKLPIKQGWTFGEKRCLVELCTKGIFSYEKITGFTLRSALSTPIELMMQGASSSAASGDGLLHEESSLHARQAPNNSLAESAAHSGSRTSSIVATMMNMMLGSRESATSGAGGADLMPLESSGFQSAKRLERSSAQQAISSSSSSNLAITEHCRHSCDLGYLNCPAFTIDYRNNRCQRLDRNSQGRHLELVGRDAFAYYEKICLRVPEIMSMCQDKYWIFERVLGHELAPRLYDKTLKFVQSRRDCQEYCLEEKQFQCRSALYNDETSDCKLSRYDRRLAQLEGGYYRNFNARISYLENNCVRDHNIGGQQQQQCAYEQIKDEPAYPTFTERIELAPATVATTSSPSSMLSASYANLVADDSNKAQGGGGSNHSRRTGAAYCEQLCNDNAKFECHSFGYYASTSQCFLSADDSISAGDLATTPSTGFVYFERKCRFSANQSEPEELPADASRVPTSEAGHQRPNMAPATTPNSLTTSSQANPYLQQPISTRSPAGEQLGTTSAQPVGANGSEPADDYKCGQGHTFVFQRIAGFEPIGGYLTLLVKNNEQPGIVAECAELCQRAYECRAFVLDYASNQCFAMLENSSVGLLSLRQTLGKDYFEGFCLANHLLVAGGGGNCRQKSWLVDKIVDQAVIGVHHQKALANSNRAQCRLACLEERLFWCKSAMFDSATGECKLYSIERESVPQMRLLFTKGVDFFENQCQIASSACPYDAIERDMTHTTVTKSIQARSTFDCELACNSELSFNCRSYTYLDKYPSLPNLCLLSSDSRSTSQRGSVKEQAKSLYAERNCYYRRPRYPGSNQAHQIGQRPPSYAQSIGPQVAAEAPAFGGGGDQSNLASRQYGLQPPVRLASTSDQEFGVENEPLGPALGQSRCEAHQFTFERTFGYDFRLAPKERAAIVPAIGLAIGCQQECLRRAERCQAFVIDYALPYQSCFLLDTQAGANKKLLVRAPNSAYFEKVCLPRTGLGSLPETETSVVDEPALSHWRPAQATPPAIQLHETMSPSQSLDISPSYSHEPWTTTAKINHQDARKHQPLLLPYYLQQQQQQQQHYPSRSCPKLWSFERFVNFNFTAPVDKLLENTLSRAQCETACINEANFACRAATYDYGAKLCRLFKSTRRTLLSQFVDLESSAPPAPTQSTTTTTTNGLQITSGTESHPGTAQLLSGNESIETAASELRQRAGARQLVSGAPPITAEPLNAAKNVDYLENSCAPEPSSCQYRQVYDQFSPFIDKVLHSTSLGDCQRQCDQERLFSCKSVNYDANSRNCMLVNEDLISLSRGQLQQQQQLGQSALLPKKGAIYSEKGNCELVSVQCNSQEMLVSINFDAPFRGRVMAKGNPEQCYLLGDGQTSLQFGIVFGPKCNSRQEGHNTFVNELIIQQHPVIMTESDKTIRVMCAFEAPEQTISLKSPSLHGNKTIAGIDVGAPAESGRTRHDKQHFNSVVSSKAPPPSVVLHILDQNGRDASMINLGDELVLRIQMQTEGQHNSALGIFARNLAARSANGESLLLIDNDGCPVDQQVFPALELDSNDGKSLQSRFKAFRFPSSGLVNFEVQIRFCPERCQPVDCQRGGQRLRSLGRKRRDLEAQSSQVASHGRTVPILQSGEANSLASDKLGLVSSSLDSLSTVMKPGKAFEYVRKLLLVTQAPVAQADGLPPQASEQAPPTSASHAMEEFERGSDADQLEANREHQPAPTVYSQPYPANSFEFAESAAESPAEIGAAEQPAASGQSVHHHHIEEPLVPSVGLQPGASAATASVKANQPVAPYSRFPLQSDIDLHQPGQQQQQQQQQAAIGELATIRVTDGAPLRAGPIVEPAQSISINTDTANLGQAPSELSSNNWDQTSSTQISTQSAEAPQNKQQQQQLDGQGADMPLRFSILVGENNNQQAGQVNSASSNTAPGQLLIMNSSNVELDHIVLPGKLNQHTSAPDELSGQTKTSKRNASYEQTFDTMSSNSIASHSNQSNLQQQQAAASHDCQIESGRSKLKTIIWTGSLVIALNICLVLLSLVLYFKRVHLRHDSHTIVSAASDCGTQLSASALAGRRRSRWPSVILKSKSSLLPSANAEALGAPATTSLNTHEHFFCKLNSKHTDHRDFNWPNLSSSCSHSTISSLASGIPPIERCSQAQNHLRPSLKSVPFDAHSSLRNGNFMAASVQQQQQQLQHEHKTILDVNSSRIPAPNEYSARYTSNIDDDDEDDDDDNHHHVHSQRF